LVKIPARVPESTGILRPENLLTLTNRRFTRRCPPATTPALCAAPAIPRARPWSRSTASTN